MYSLLVFCLCVCSFAMRCCSRRVDIKTGDSGSFAGMFVEPYDIKTQAFSTILSTLHHFEGDK